MKLARYCHCLIVSGKSFHRYGPIILSDFFLLFVRANEILSADRLAVLVLYVCMVGWSQLRFDFDKTLLDSHSTVIRRATTVERRRIKVES